MEEIISTHNNGETSPPTDGPFADTMTDTDTDTTATTDTDTDTDTVTTTGTDADPDTAGSAPENQFSTMPPPPVGQAPIRRLYRTKGPISGVAAGLADYFNVDAALVRLGLAAGTLIGGPIVPIGYIAAWIIIPEADPAPVAPIMTSAAASASAPAPSTAPVPAAPNPPAPVDDVLSGR